MSDAALPPLPFAPEFSVVARRFNCLPARQRWLFFGILAGFSLAVAASVAGLGAWPVLPYSGVELAAITAAFCYVERRAGDWERLSVAADRVIVERAWGGIRERREFDRYWLRVELAPPGDTWRRQSRLELRCKGEAVVFGETLAEHERARIARELRKLVAAR